MSVLLSFGSQMEVLSPGYWRELLCQELKKSAGIYET